MSSPCTQSKCAERPTQCDRSACSVLSIEVESVKWPTGSSSLLSHRVGENVLLCVREAREMQKGHHCDNNNNNDNNNIMSLTNVFKLRAKTKVKFKTTTTAATPTNNSTSQLLLLILQTILLMLTAMPTATMTTLTTATSVGGGGGGVLTEMASITAATTALRQQQRPQQLQQLLLVRTLALVARPVDEMAETDTHEAETKAQLHRGGSINDANNFVTLRSRRRRNHNNNNMDIYDLLNANHLSAFPPSPASSSSWLTTSSFPASSQSSLTSSLSSLSSSFLPSSFSPSSPSSSPSATSSLLTQMMPVFDFGLPRNITARSGQTAAINCRVENLGDKSVSWIRKRDLHILTAGILTYTSDERFRVVRTDDSKTWSLHVKFAQPRDSGIYECQVNTEPKISMAFRLNVRVTPPDSKAIIDGPADLYAKVGSAITLNCRVNQPSSQDIGPIYWYRGPYALTPFVAHPNDAAIDLSRRISMESQLGDVLKSRLRIANAHTADSANYTCMPTTAEAASVMVHVIDDEHPAAMQKSSAARRLQFDGQHIISIIITFMPFSQLLHNLLSFQRTS